MSLISFRDWIIAKESSPATRSKMQASLGLGPDVASVFGHSTPPAWQTKRLLKKLKKNGKDSELPGEDPPKSQWTIPEEKQPDYTFDKWVKNLIKKSGEVESLKKTASEEEEKLDKEVARLKDQDEKEKKEKAKTDHPPKEEEKESKWAGSKTETEEQEKAGIQQKREK